MSNRAFWLSVLAVIVAGAGAFLLLRDTEQPPARSSATTPSGANQVPAGAGYSSDQPPAPVATTTKTATVPEPTSAAVRAAVAPRMPTRTLRRAAAVLRRSNNDTSNRDYPSTAVLTRELANANANYPGLLVRRIAPRVYILCQKITGKWLCVSRIRRSDRPRPKLSARDKYLQKITAKQTPKLPATEIPGYARTQGDTAGAAIALALENARSVLHSDFLLAHRKPATVKQQHQGPSFTDLLPPAPAPGAKPVTP